MHYLVYFNLIYIFQFLIFFDKKKPLNYELNYNYIPLVK